MDSLKIGRLIKKKRIEAKLSQEQLAEILNVSSKTVSRWETGKSIPELSKIDLITKKLNITSSELINGEEQRFQKEETKKNNNIYLGVFLLITLVFIDISYGFFKSLIFWIVNDRNLGPNGVIYRLIFSNNTTNNSEGIIISKMLNIYVITIMVEVVAGIIYFNNHRNKK